MDEVLGVDEVLAAEMDRALVTVLDAVPVSDVDRRGAGPGVNMGPGASMGPTIDTTPTMKSFNSC